MPAIDEAEVRALAGHAGQGGPVVSWYLSTDGHALPRPLDLDDEVLRLLRDGRAKAAGHPSALADFDRIEAYVRDEFDRSRVRGLVIFACSADGWWKVFELAVPVHSRVTVNGLPAVGQLESIVHDFERMAVLLADRELAKLFVFELGELVDRSELFEALPRDYDSRGHSDRGYEAKRQHVDELAHQHLRHAAQVAFDMFQSSGFEHLAIGAAPEVAGDLEAELHPYLRERLRGRLHVGISASMGEIRSEALALQASVDRARDAEAVARLREAVGIGSKAVTGLADVLGALHDKRVDRLLVSAGYEETGWHCDACGRLAHVGRVCPSCGAEMRHLDDVVEETIELALVQGCKVDICIDNADLDVLGRIGAFLRY
jgi:rubrerythrin